MPKNNLQLIRSEQWWGAIVSKEEVYIYIYRDNLFFKKQNNCVRIFKTIGTGF